MDKKVYRPLWSYDVEKSERWLSSMSEKGYHLNEMNRKTRCFIFKQGNPQKTTYRINYDIVQGEALPQALKEDGWRKVSVSKHWHFLANERDVEQIKRSPIREGIIHRNRKHFYIHSFITMFFTFVAIMNLSLLLPMYLLHGGPVYVEESPYWIITFSGLAFVFFTWVLSVYSMWKIRKTNQRLILDSDDSYEQEDVVKRENMNELKPTEKLIVKRKFGWMYAPDKLEKWLGKMEEKGYHLQRVSWAGTAFYFSVGTPRRISYCLDYQTIAKENAMNFHLEAGWKNVYSTKSTLQKWTIWSKEYHGEEKPTLYSDKETELKHAKKIAITYSGLFTPLILMYIYLIASYVSNASQVGLDKLSWINLMMLALLIVIFGSFSLRSWLYFLRLKKS